MIPFLILITLANIAPIDVIAKIGNFTNLKYDVAGSVFSVNSTNLLISKFNYSGGAPDAIFWAGTDGTPDDTKEETTAILAHPFSGKHYEYSATDYPVLGKAENEDIFLTLPPHLQASDLKWLSVWCKAYSVNFGDVEFKDDSGFENKFEVMSTISEKTVNHALDMSNNTYNETDNEDNSAQNESENNDPEEPEMISIVMNIISSVRNAIGTVQGYLDFF